MLKYTSAEYPYFSLEDPDTLELIKRDPRDFLKRFKDGVILDEAQKYPELFSYLQRIVDDSMYDRNKS